MATLFIVAPALAACISMELPTRDERTLTYGCDDLVVVGRLQNGDFEHVEIEDDILGHGWFFAHLKVREVVKGDVLSDQIPIRYFAHTYLREDRDFMFVLREAEDGEFRLRSASLVSIRPFLAARCEPSAA
jgi:hypothetical protein